MAREHPATARSSDSFTQESKSSAAATIGNPASAATAKHANTACRRAHLHRMASARWPEQPGWPIAIPRALIRALVRVAAEMVHQRDWTLCLRFGDPERTSGRYNLLCCTMAIEPHTRRNGPLMADDV